jgi:AbrB family looped-hinge helix DNA binding protein
MTKSPKNKGLAEDHKMYGTTVLGARGQLVIPAEARKDLNLKPGDRVLVVSKFKKMLGMMKVSELGEVVEMLMEKINSKDISAEMKKKAIQELTQFKNSHVKLKGK